MLQLLKDMFDRTFPAGLYSALNKELKDCKSVLDVGCGKNSILRFFSGKIYSEGVDVFPPAIEQSAKHKIHNKYHLRDLLKLDFKDKSFDCVLALDVIEHFEKKQGAELIKKMEAIAADKVIIFTTNGFVPQRALDDNPWQVHKSGWEPEEMRQLGFEVVGINGHKGLRGEAAELKFRPKLFWLLVSWFSQWFVRRNAKAAFQILCVKKVNKDG